MSIPASMYAWPSDLVDEGVEGVIAAVRDQGINAISLAASYHQARDVVPHAGPKPRLRYRDDAVFVPLDEDRWQNVQLRPEPGPPAEVDALVALLRRPDRPTIEGWTVMLHQTSLGSQHPELTSLTCFGDRIRSNLCPAQPDVVAYAVALAGQVAVHGLDVVAEALSAQTFGHGHHHERSFAPVSLGDEALLGLCFCNACSSRAAARGADAERLAASVAVRVQRAYGGAPPIPADPDALSDAVGEDLTPLVRGRMGAVTELSGAVAREVHAHGQRLSFMDLTGAVLGYGTGAPTGPPAADQSWQLSIDLGAVAPLVDSVTVLGYASDVERLRLDVASAVAAAGPTPVRVILRPGHPDTVSAEHLIRKVAASREAGAAQVDFYAYGMLDRSVLDRIGPALRA